MNMIDHLAEKIVTGTEKDFLKSLRDEKLRAQEARNHLTIQKLTFATALIGLGSIKLDAGVVNTSLLAYLTPWVAIVFDFYIFRGRLLRKTAGRLFAGIQRRDVGTPLGEMGERAS